MTAEESLAAASVPRVLIVDDDQRILKVVGELCRDMGLVVATARDGVEALKALRGGGADLMLLDLAMPRLDGFGVLEKLRAEPADPNPVVIVVTASADVAGKMRGTELGAWDFVDKPFRVPDLQRRIERVLAIRDLEVHLAGAEQQFWAMRTTDAATGVGTFAQLYEALEGEFRWARAQNAPLSCVVVSNESYGKSSASQDLHEDEEKLHHTAQLVSDNLGTPGRLFRVDAAEVVALLPACSVAQAREVVDRIAEALARAEGLAGADFVFAAATFPHPEISEAHLLYRAANMTLAQARALRDRRVGFFDGFGCGD